MQALIVRLAGVAVVYMLCLPAEGWAQASGSERRGLVGVAVGTYSVTADAVEGTLTATGVNGSVAINRFLDFEAELLRPHGTAQREHTGILFAAVGPGATREEIEREGVVVRTAHERTIDAVLSFGAAFHPHRGGRRFQPRVFTGITTHFARDETQRDPLSWPSSVTEDQIARMVPRVEQHRRAIGSLTIGAAVSIDLSDRLALVPDIRYDYGSIGDEINNWFRAGVRLAWRF